MDSDRFDRLARSVSTTSTRRTLVRLLATVPVAGGLLTLLTPDDVLAGKDGKSKSKNGTGTSGSNTVICILTETTCNGNCGTVLNNCGQLVDCVGQPCTPVDGGISDAVCQADARCCVPSGGQCGGEGCSSANCCSFSCGCATGCD
jgi:hypothetical protein